MIADWLLIALVVVVLFTFWLWLGILFDQITEYHRKTQASARRREDAQATKGTGSSSL